MKEDKDVKSKFIDEVLALEFEKRVPIWLLMIVVTIIFTSLGLLSGNYIHPFFLIIFSSAPIYPLYLSQFKVQQYGKAIKLTFVWAITISVIIILFTLGYSSLASKAVVLGSSYQEDMFNWIATGIGSEGTPSIFIPENLINATVFTTFSLASAGFLALLFGAYQMNYMNFYVGMLLSRVINPTPNNFVMVFLLSWPIYAIIRVVGFIFIGVATTIPLSSKIFNKDINSRIIIKFFLVGTILVGMDIVIKTLVAPFYRELLQELVNVA